jgi:hypothetical protein
MVCAKQGFRNDVSPGGCGRDGDEDGDVDHHAVAGTGGMILGRGTAEKTANNRRCEEAPKKGRRCQF